MNGMDPNAGLLFRSIPSILTIQGWNLRRGLFLLGALLGLAQGHQADRAAGQQAQGHGAGLGDFELKSFCFGRILTLYANSCSPDA